MDVSATSDPDVSCVSSSSSEGFEITDVPDRSKSVAAVKKKKFKFRNRDKSKKNLKTRKNQISVDDFALKKQEFSKWLVEEKKLQLNKVDDKRRKTLFKKFVNKWNNQKLPAHYYRETDSLWIVTSPFSPAAKHVKRTKSSVLPTRESKAVPDSKCSPSATRAKYALSSSASVRVSKSVVESMLPISSPCLPSTPTPSTPNRPQFGTFGKKAGARLLAKLRMNETWCSERLKKPVVRNTPWNDIGFESERSDMEQPVENVICDSKIKFPTFQPPQRSRGRRAPVSSIFPESSTVL